jgi:pimeloyl-ACP methyl ester carboxylesterase
MTADNVTLLGITYANHDGVELQGDLYLPKGAKSAPALVAVHGGGWVQGVRAAFQFWGPYLAARGYAVFAVSYRLATKGKTFPQAVQDVLAGVQFLRGKAGEFGIDPQRIGLLGASAGGHLASLAALSGKKFTGGYPQDPFASVSTEVKALVGVYGVYDMVAMWTTYQIQGGVDNNIQKFLGASPMENRQLYFDASSASYATFANNKIGVLLSSNSVPSLRISGWMVSATLARSQGSTTSRRTWSSSTSIVPLAVCASAVTRNCRRLSVQVSSWRVKNWPNFSWALSTPDFRRRTASSRPSRCGMVTTRGLLIGRIWGLSFADQTVKL